MAVSRSHVFVGALAGAGVAVAAMAGVGMRPAGLGADFQSHLIKASAPVLPAAPGAPLSFADIFEKVSPAVVSINVTSKADSSQLVRKIPGFENFPFDILPKGQGQETVTVATARARPSNNPPAPASSSPRTVSSSPTTTSSTTPRTSRWCLKDGKELKAVVVGRDEGTDLAVIRVEGRGFPFVDFENSSRPRVGDWVLAVGNPFSLGNTATAGIVSAYNRDIGENFVDYIQIDAPINRGNSGGPTFDTYGRVIGVNTAIFSPSGGSVGIGFDIPADVASNITKQLMSGAKIRRGYIGATIQNLSDEMADSWGLGGRKGAVVADLVAGGPAQHAGVQPGDVVVAVNGHPVTSPNEMTREVAKVPAGDLARLDVFRAGKERTLDVHTGSASFRSPAGPERRRRRGDGDSEAGPDGAKSSPNAPILGMSLTPIDPASRQQYSIAAAVRGVLVEGVKGSSDAGEKGLHRGDVIVRAGDREVASAADVSAAVAEWKRAGRTSIPLAVNRGGRTLFVPIKIDG